MGKKEYFSLLASLALLFADNPNYQNQEKYKALTEEEKKEIKRIMQERKVERLRKRGVKEFRYGNRVIYAINKKNADRKAKKLKLI